MHGMCGYLEGCSFSLKRGARLDYQVEVNCCTSPEKKRRLSMERRFKLNFEKVIFREDQEIYSYLRERAGEEEK